MAGKEKKLGLGFVGSMRVIRSFRSGPSHSAAVHARNGAVAQCKGGKDRYAMLSPRLLSILRAYRKRERPISWRVVRRRRRLAQLMRPG